MHAHFKAAGIGDPEEHFFRVVAMRQYNEWNETTLDDPRIMDQLAKHYGRGLYEHKVANDVFCAKVFIINIEFMKKCIDLDTDTYYIYLTRNDRFAQFVSLLSIFQTQQPWDDGLVLPSLPKYEKYDEDSIRFLYDHVFSMPTDFLEKALASIEPKRIVRVSMEEFVSDPVAFVKKVGEQFNLKINQNYLDGEDLPKKEKYTRDIDTKQNIINQYGDIIRKVMNEKKV